MNRYGTLLRTFFVHFSLEALEEGPYEEKPAISLKENTMSCGKPRSVRNIRDREVRGAAIVVSEQPAGQ